MGRGWLEPFEFDGFRVIDGGIRWFPTKAALLAGLALGPQHALVACSYQSLGNTKRKQAGKQVKKYAAFMSHREYWEYVLARLAHGELQNLFEVMLEDRPRCLYFDLDGDPKHWSAHVEVVKALQRFVYRFFDGPSQGWALSDLTPVVLTSAQPIKYSAHVLSPRSVSPITTISKNTSPRCCGRSPRYRFFVEGKH